MAEYTALKPLFSDIANAIREKDGSTETIPAETFPERIKAISFGISSVKNRTPKITLSNTFTDFAYSEVQNRYVLVAGNIADSIVYTDDFETFTPVRIPKNMHEFTYNPRITCFNGIFIVIDNVLYTSDQTSSPYIYSSDGINWSPSTVNIRQVYDIENNGSFVIICGIDSSGNNVFAKSTDGINWTYKTYDINDSPADAIGANLKFLNGRFVKWNSFPDSMDIVSLTYSTDGLNWILPDWGWDHNVNVNSTCVFPDIDIDSSLGFKYKLKGFSYRIEDITYFNGNYIIIFSTDLSRSFRYINGEWELAESSGNVAFGNYYLSSTNFTAWNANKIENSKLPSTFSLLKSIPASEGETAVVVNQNILFHSDYYLVYSKDMSSFSNINAGWYGKDLVVSNPNSNKILLLPQSGNSVASYTIS